MTPALPMLIAAFCRLLGSKYIWRQILTWTSAKNSRLAIWVRELHVALSLLSDKNLLLSSNVCIYNFFFALKRNTSVEIIRFYFLRSLLLHIIFNSCFINSTIDSNYSSSSIVKIVNECKFACVPPVKQKWQKQNWAAHWLVSNILMGILSLKQTRVALRVLLLSCRHSK